ncbi:hypothetical protein [Pseudoclavibacter sp. 13-3]|uniref:hypothetical protein n=1 Tax=Pseudoclavibacter sp. 13-3 TaxID=2901228 RepID=UPI001E2F93D0|nr:hypothetical protein [Pseudoclavibacter sp. 13-3]MCD7101068.1 hypothetical protein [Pseudoclavibacter sp. 13-3]
MKLLPSLAACAAAALLIACPATAASAAAASGDSTEDRHPQGMLTTKSTQQVMCTPSPEPASTALRRGIAQLSVDRAEVTSAWIDIEQSNLDPATLHVTLDREGTESGDPEVTVIDGTAGATDGQSAVHATTWGVTVVVPMSVGDYTLSVSTPQTDIEQSTVALTTLDASGAWVDAGQRVMPLALDEPGDADQPDASECSDDNGHAGADEDVNGQGAGDTTPSAASDGAENAETQADAGAGSLARTGMVVGWTLGIVAALAAAGLALMWFARRRSPQTATASGKHSALEQRDSASTDTSTDQENNR